MLLLNAESARNSCSQKWKCVVNENCYTDLELKYSISIMSALDENGSQPELMEMVLEDGTHIELSLSDEVDDLGSAPGEDFGGVSTSTRRGSGLSRIGGSGVDGRFLSDVDEATSSSIAHRAKPGETAVSFRSPLESPYLLYDTTVPQEHPDFEGEGAGSTTAESHGGDRGPFAAQTSKTKGNAGNKVQMKIPVSAKCRQCDPPGAAVARCLVCEDYLCLDCRQSFRCNSPFELCFPSRSLRTNSYCNGCHTMVLQNRIRRHTTSLRTPGPQL
ncbi:unnamed protein product [Amoebophrya sp. A25]|nr:unnamed protein product [Amoebophrya sp. A25]|eukprot:GSA25T00001075001.1